MGFLWSPALLLQFLFLYSLFSFTVTNCVPLIQPKRCLEGESHALLQFMEGFVINKFASEDPFSYPRTVSWNASIDCCSWDGIKCDGHTGHVIGIDLSSSQLYGTVDANSSLFGLIHLQMLDLADNDFNYSQIPSRIGELSQLKYLNLSQTKFYGEIPQEVSRLSKLLSLDLGSCTLSAPYYSNSINLVRFEISTLRSLIQNSTSLEILRLSFVTISASVPDILTNLTYLQELYLSRCELYGEFPAGIFHLPNLRLIYLTFNHLLRGKFPDFHSSPLINKLELSSTSFYGTLPASIGNLKSLNFLSIGQCNFSASIPSSLSNLTQLTFLKLGSNHLSGEVPSWIMNLTNLELLDLGENHLKGEIPDSLFKLEKLESLNLGWNLLQGEIELDKLLNLNMLIDVDLSFNKVSSISGRNPSNATLSQIESFALGSCKLVGFPNFIRDLSKLRSLYMSFNSVKSIPNWLWRKRTLRSIRVSHNSLTGEISPTICNLKSLTLLDLSFNNLSGKIPSCLGNFSRSLKILTLKGNKLSGLVPQKYMIRNSLQMIDFSNNNLQGQLPRALVNCGRLEFLDVSHNNINDSFPFWLEALPELKVLALHDNEFHGAIKCPSTKTCAFPKLHIIDLSHNDFSGNLPSEMIQSWKSMKASNAIQLQYEPFQFYMLQRKGVYEVIEYSLTISNKGVVMSYESIQDICNMIAIDISSNRISGEIPEIMGDLKGLILLNLSNNRLTGSIPSSLGKLSNLETLDFSLNSLSGKIPQQLTQLTFLEFFNVSFNNLSGPIPQDKQFDTFLGNSYEGNQGLCGNQLLQKCGGDAGSSFVPPSASDGDQDSGSFFEFDWKVVLIGYAGGFVAGVALGSTYCPQILAWLKRVF